ncbi:hypothetical protein FNV43_RR19384 [Rhamnella rubrinervis]|uniref:Uncharacterized protein n=1 Tax=Rhamnella rubrinervis TaxID=2594499 RepID=A0A8K0DYG1_9ROSA|nr:hypothetical protein FNV43_RR19384 [Rhamnella rubrinervis]
MVICGFIGTVITSDKGPTTTADSTEKGKNSTISSSKRTGKEVAIVGAWDLVVYLGKMMAFLTPDIHEDTRRANMTYQLADYAGTSVRHDEIIDLMRDRNDQLTLEFQLTMEALLETSRKAAANQAKEGNDEEEGGNWEDQSCATSSTMYLPAL